MSPITTNGLFSQLLPLLEHRAVMIVVSKIEGDQLQVNICPRQLKQGENPALTIPLCITGTASELDNELVLHLAGFVECHVGLNTNLAAIEKEIAEAEKAAREEAAKKKQKAAGGKKSTEPNGVTAPTVKPEPDRPPMFSLFDRQPETAASALPGSGPRNLGSGE